MASTMGKERGTHWGDRRGGRVADGVEESKVGRGGVAVGGRLLKFIIFFKFCHSILVFLYFFFVNLLKKACYNLHNNILG